MRVRKGRKRAIEIELIYVCLIEQEYDKGKEVRREIIL